MSKKTKVPTKLDEYGYPVWEKEGSEPCIWRSGKVFMRLMKGQFKDSQELRGLLLEVLAQVDEDIENENKRGALHDAK